MSSEGQPNAAAPPSVDWIAERVKEAKQFREADTEKAVEILSETTEKAVAQYGESAPELAELYLVYGMYLFELAQQNTTALGPRGELAAATQEAGAGGDAGKGSQDDQHVAKQDGNGDEEATEPVQQQGEEEEEEEQEEDEEEEELDDMQLALSIMFAARTAYRAMGPEEQYCNELADIQVVIGSILIEQEEFEEAVQELTVVLGLLSLMTDKRVLRRQGEAHFKLMLANHFLAKNEEALQHCRAAITALQDEAELVEADANSAAEAGGDDAAAKVASCQASLADLQQTLPDMQHWEDELRDLVDQKKALKETLHAMALQMIGQASASASAFASAASTSATAGAVGSLADAPKERQPVQDLGVVGRGKKRLELKPVTTPITSVVARSAAAPSTGPSTSAFAAASTAASAALTAAGTGGQLNSAPSKKRDLDAMMGGSITGGSGFGRPSSGEPSKKTADL